MIDMKKLVPESLNESFSDDVKWSLINDFDVSEGDANRAIHMWADKIQYSMEDGWDSYEMAEELSTLI